jgi:hypothetical protein
MFLDYVAQIVPIGVTCYQVQQLFKGRNFRHLKFVGLKQMNNVHPFLIYVVTDLA